MFDPYEEEERLAEQKRRRFWEDMARIGDFSAILIGIITVLALLILLFSMISFIRQNVTVFLSTIFGGM